MALTKLEALYMCMVLLGGVSGQHQRLGIHAASADHGCLEMIVSREFRACPRPPHACDWQCTWGVGSLLDSSINSTKWEQQVQIVNMMSHTTNVVIYSLGLRAFVGDACRLYHTDHPAS
jgi:hypothetical protein